MFKMRRETHQKRLKKQEILQEKSRGSIQIGKLADLVVLSDDPLAIPPNKIGDIKVDMTLVDGEIVYDRQRSQQRRIRRS
jgi:predicted amidohydrolase YtcJ